MGEYELIEHDADIGIRVTAPSEEDLFSTAGNALFAILADLSSIEPRSREHIQVAEDSLEDLMVAWLSELAYLHSSKSFLGREISHVELCRGKAFRLTADVVGETYDPDRHVILEEIKTVTYHGLKVAEHNGQWTCEVILDV
jgi:SHS2 domain-containing protein